MKSNLHTGKEAKERLISGIRKCAAAVGSTMGTAGGNAIIEAIENPGHLVTNDGATILGAIHFEDPLEEMGRKIVVEAVSRANKASGDGSSTTTVLTDAILEAGNDKGAKPMEIKNSLEACLPIIEKSLKEQKRDVANGETIDLNLLEQVATISAEDSSIGKMIADIYRQIGVGGIIHWDVSKTFEDHYTLGKGITMEGAGLASPYFADMDEKTGQFTTALRWKNPKILITKQKITTAAEFEQLFVALNSAGRKEIVIFCDEYEPTVIPPLVQTKIAQGFKSALVKMPTIFKDHWYADLAATTGATVIDPVAGITFKTMNGSHLGEVGNIVIDKENTYIDGIKDTTDHIRQLTEMGDEESMLRVSRLNTKTARYFVGATSDSALSYRRLKVEDALHSAYYSLKDGVVPGGGVSLRNCADVMPDTIGGEILAKALLRPEEQIAANAGLKEYVGREVNVGLDSRTGEYVDMFEKGIVDTTSIVMNAVRNAVSVAAAVLTCGVIIEFPKQSIADAVIEDIMKRKL